MKTLCLTLLSALLSLTAFAQSSFNPKGERLTPEQVKSGTPFFLQTCYVDQASSCAFTYDPTQQRSGFYSTITPYSVFKAEKIGETDTYHIVNVATGQKLQIKNNGQHPLTYTSTDEQAGAFTIEAVTRQAFNGDNQVVAGTFDNDQQVIRIRKGNQILNCCGNNKDAEFRGGSRNWTIFIPYAVASPVKEITVIRNYLTGNRKGEKNQATAKVFTGQSIFSTAAVQTPFALPKHTADIQVEENKDTYEVDYLGLVPTMEKNKIYYILGGLNGHFFCHKPNTHFLWIDGKDNVELDLQSEAFKWSLIEHNGQNYLYNLQANRFAAPLAKEYSNGSYTSTPAGQVNCTWVFTHIPAPVVTEAMTANNRQGMGKVSSNGVYLNLTKNMNGPAISWYTENDSNIPFFFMESDEEATTATAKGKEQLQNLTLNFKPGGDDSFYTTLYVDNHITVPEEVEVYTVSQETEEKITLQKQDSKTIPAKQGVILRKKTAEPIILGLTYNHSEITNYTNNLLQGSTEASEVNNAYALSVGDKGLGFYPSQLNEPFPAFHAYLPQTPASAPFLLTFGDITTNVTQTLQTKAPTYYNLYGCKISNPTKGIYIINGKKIIK